MSLPDFCKCDICRSAPTWTKTSGTIFPGSDIRVNRQKDTSGIYHINFCLMGVGGTIPNYEPGTPIYYGGMKMEAVKQADRDQYQIVNPEWGHGWISKYGDNWTIWIS